jgi:hypothetical protein
LNIQQLHISHTIKRRDDYGKRRFIAYVNALKDETTSFIAQEYNNNNNNTNATVKTTTNNHDLNQSSSFPGQIRQHTDDDNMQGKNCSSSSSSGAHASATNSANHAVHLELLDMISVLEKDIFPYLSLPEYEIQDIVNQKNDDDNDDDNEAEKETFSD